MYLALFIFLENLTKFTIITDFDYYNGFYKYQYVEKRITLFFDLKKIKEKSPYYLTNEGIEKDLLVFQFNDNREFVKTSVLLANQIKLKLHNDTRYIYEVRISDLYDFLFCRDFL